MKRPLWILLILVMMMAPSAFSSASADMTEGLIYDETDNTWASGDEDLTELAAIMKRECAKSPLIKGTYILATGCHSLSGQGKVRARNKNAKLRPHPSQCADHSNECLDSSLAELFVSCLYQVNFSSILTYERQMSDVRMVSNLDKDIIKQIDLHFLLYMILFQ